MSNKIAELTDFLHKENIHVAALQETKLSAKSCINIPNFTLIRQDRTAFGGGLAFHVNHSIKFTPIEIAIIDFSGEFQMIELDLPNPISIINCYIPPHSSCPPGYKASLNPLFNLNPSLIVGDFNAHHSLWYSNLDQNTRGNKLSAEIEMSLYGILNSKSPTRLPINGNPSSPDISLASPNLLPDTTWRVATRLNSDHLPIIISLENKTPLQSPKYTFLNFNKADWSKFTVETEALFNLSLKTTSSLKAPNKEKVFRAIITKISKKSRFLTILSPTA